MDEGKSAAADAQREESPAGSGSAGTTTSPRSKDANAPSQSMARDDDDESDFEELDGKFLLQPASSAFSRNVQWRLLDGELVTVDGSDRLCEAQP